MANAHEGVSCDCCSVTAFRLRRFKCLICIDFDVCGPCYDEEKETATHKKSHPMQCILTVADHDLFYAGETCCGRVYSYVCSICGLNGFSITGITEHVDREHRLDNDRVLCPICACRGSGNPNEVFTNLARHMNAAHKENATDDNSSKKLRKTGTPNSRITSGATKALIAKPISSSGVTLRQSGASSVSVLPSNRVPLPRRSSIYQQRSFASVNHEMDSINALVADLVKAKTVAQSSQQSERRQQATDTSKSTAVTGSTGTKNVATSNAVSSSSTEASTRRQTHLESFNSQLRSVFSKQNFPTFDDASFETAFRVLEQDVSDAAFSTGLSSASSSSYSQFLSALSGDRTQDLRNFIDLDYDEEEDEEETEDQLSDEGYNALGQAFETMTGVTMTNNQQDKETSDVTLVSDSADSENEDLYDPDGAVLQDYLDDTDEVYAPSGLSKPEDYDPESFTDATLQKELVEVLGQEGLFVSEARRLGRRPVLLQGKVDRANKALIILEILRSGASLSETDV